MYCLKCKKDTKDLNIKGFITKNNRYMLKSTCNVFVNVRKVNLFQKRK